MQAQCFKSGVDIGLDIDTTAPMIKLSRNTPFHLILHVIQGHAQQ